MPSLVQRHQTFHDLHQSGCFVIPNPWDAGSAKIFAAHGAKALATSSAAHAFTLGRPDMGLVTRDEALDHAAHILEATDLPVSGDFENGFTDDPDGVAETIKLAAEAGLSGCSIEDTQMVAGNPAYDFNLAIERIKAAVSAARALPHPFVLCARADGVMNGTYDFDEGLRRAVAFDHAGADLIYMPIPGSINNLRLLVQSVSKPVNSLAAGKLADLSMDDLKKIGVRRVSVGSMVARCTHQVIDTLAQGMLKQGSFAGFSNAASGKDIDVLLAMEKPKAE